MKRETPWSVYLFSVGGIPVKLHLSFFLLITWVMMDQIYSAGHPFVEVLFLGVVFACIVAHELAHALVARRYDIKTRDITLYPFGGIASILGHPKPKAEFFIAAAGPLVNILVALALLPLLETHNVNAIFENQDLISRVFIANIAIAIFNLIPALPMDGGRILRAGLGMLGLKSATAIASRISQFLSILLAFFALAINHVWLVVIAVLVFSFSVQELLADKTRAMAFGRRVREVMIDPSQFHVFTHGTTVSHALNISLRSFQDVFPVLCGSAVLGIVDKDVLLKSFSTEEDDGYVSAIMHREYLSVDPEELVSEVLTRPGFLGAEPILVLQNGNLVGMLLKDKLIECLLVQSIGRRSDQYEDSFQYP